jgi:uncharacterized membrane protein
MTGDPCEVEWENPATWRAGWLHIYVAPRDRRLLVPMRPRWLGWTLNWGQRRTWLLVVVVYAVMLTVMLIAAASLGAPGALTWRGV